MKPQVVQALVRRDRRAWAALYDCHVGEVFGVAYQLAGRDRAVAEDICQEVWLLAIEQVNRFDPARGEFRDWLLGIARHRALRRRRDRLRGLRDGCDGPEDASAPVDCLEGPERAELVRGALLCLKEDRRQVLLDKYVERLSVGEIAARSGRSAKAVESLLSRAREQLRALLDPYFSDTMRGDPDAPTNAQTAR